MEEAHHLNNLQLALFIKHKMWHLRQSSFRNSNLLMHTNSKQVTEDLSTTETFALPNTNFHTLKVIENKIISHFILIAFDFYS